jgi:hypothetical protein
MGQKLDFKGRRFGHLLVIKEAPIVNARTRWECVCDCGKKRIVTTDALQRGATKGCGSCGKIKHGLDGTPIYRLWAHIRERCYSECHKDYLNYGGRGIEMKNGWKDDVVKFKKDLEENLGQKPGPDFSIDRIDNNGHYEIGNIRWATKSQQQLNKRIMSSMSTEFRGVRTSGGKFRAIIRNGKKIEALGTFDSPEEAAFVRDKRMYEIHGKDVPLNFPLEKHKELEKLFPVQIKRKREDASSKFFGVYQYKTNHKIPIIRFKVDLRVNGKKKFIGIFDDEIEAAKASDKAQLKYRKDKARLNFP